MPASVDDLRELFAALDRWYRAHHHGTAEDEALQSDLLAKAYAEYKSKSQEQ